MDKRRQPRQRVGLFGGVAVAVIDADDAARAMPEHVHVHAPHELTEESHSVSRRERILEFVAVLLLSVSTLAIAWSGYQAEYITVPVDEDGMRTAELDTALRGGPKFIYALPNFQNPTGVTLSLDRRRELIRLADVHGVPIVGGGL